jgi:hypothetical protein
MYSKDMSWTDWLAVFSFIGGNIWENIENGKALADKWGAYIRSF